MEEQQPSEEEEAGFEAGQGCNGGGLGGGGELRDKVELHHFSVTY